MLFLFRTSQVTKCGTLTAEATSPAPLLGFFFFSGHADRKALPELYYVLEAQQGASGYWET